MGLVQNVAIQSGFLDSPAAADLNGRNHSALYEIVDGRNRNPQVLCCLFYGKQVVNWGFAHGLWGGWILNHFRHYINYENRDALLTALTNYNGKSPLSQDRHRKTGCVATL